MGNQCDCNTLLTNKDLSKSKLKDASNQKNTPKKMKEPEGKNNYFPDSLSPAVKEQPQDPNDKVELFLGLEMMQNSSSLYNLKINTFAERVDTFYPFSQTEIIQTNRSCQFTKSMVVEYFFEMKQRYKFEIVDGSSPERQISLGNVVVNLSTILGSRNMQKSFEVPLQGTNNSYIKLIVRAEKIVEDLSHGIFDLKAYDLVNLRPSSSVSLRICRMIANVGYVSVYQSEKKHIVGGRIQWKPFNIQLRKLCNMDYQRPIKIQLFDNQSERDCLLGESIFTLYDLGPGDKRIFKLFNPFDKTKQGTIAFEKLIIKELPSFLDYVKGGLHLNAMLAIDFTGSNGDPTDPDSLHAIYQNEDKLNEYQRAIKSVCEIILDYDYDKKIPLYGFGAKTRVKNYVEHCFPLNGDLSNPEVTGLDEIMSTYKGVMKELTFSGPTLFTPVLLKAIEQAEKIKSNEDEYLILMILTDGQIHDMQTSINCLLKAAYLPLSIIIVGIGKADFSQMVVLDGDDGLEGESGETCARDLVQFVAFRDFQGIGEMLAKSVLEEIPNQVVEYFTTRGVMPRVPIKMAENFAENIYAPEEPQVDSAHQISDFSNIVKINAEKLDQE